MISDVPRIHIPNRAQNFNSHEKLSPTAMSFMVQYLVPERNIVMNPFKYGCVVDGDNFCARAEAERGSV